MCRRLFSEKIAAANQIIYQRLQTVKPSKDLSAAHLRKQWQTTQKYSRNCAGSRREHKARGPSPGRSALHGKIPAQRQSNGIAAAPEGAVHVTVPSTCEPEEPQQL
jgi:hypothetical protein